jgi:prepilin-type N-terminal cleavage/methylation domain-containing protein
MRRVPTDREDGFTLVELLVALLIMGVVLASLAPAFYGAMRAAATTNYKSVANGLAVAATEQLRSAPYYEIGYSADVAACTPPQSWQPPSWQQVNNLPSGVTNPIPATSTQTVGPVTYSTLRCLYWAPSSGNISSCGDPANSLQCQQAYKQSIVRVSWTVRQRTYTVSQTAAIYPGGQGAYSTPANNFYSSGSGGTAPTVPSAPQQVAATATLAGTAAVVQVTWQAPASANASSYLVEYGTGSTPSSSFTTVPSNTLSATLNVAVSTQYWIEVIGVNAAGQGTPSAPVTLTTPDATSTTCTVGNLVVTPGTAKVGGNGKITGSTSGFSLSLVELVPSACAASTITVQYLPQTGTTNYQYATMTGSGTLTGTAGDSNTTWSTGNHVFTAYIDGSAATPAATQQVSICQGGSGGC